MHLSSPTTPPMTLTISNVANIFVKMRRARERAKSHHIESNSGAPQTHPALSSAGATSSQKVPIVQSDLYICAGGVDVSKLLRSSRASCLERAVSIGATVLVDERWVCRICGPKNRKDGTFRVQVHYYASACRSKQPDLQRPVALNCVKNVPGLMTIIDRQEYHE